MAPPYKRKRTLSQSSEDPSESNMSPKGPPIRSEKLYLDDGNIVLVAEDTAFRVHRSQLSRHSEVFRDMLMVVDQPQDAEVFDSCPVVRLSDACADVLELLRALYDRPHFDPENIEPLISVLRLSTKYLIEHIRTAALEALSEAYPDTLLKYGNYTGNRPRCGDVIKLAHEVHADILLPAAYYTLCGCSAIDVVEFDLSQPLIKTYLLGKEWLSRELAMFVHAYMVDRDTSSNCAQLWECDEAWQTLDLDAHHMLREYCGDPPMPLTQLYYFNELDGVSDACLQCRQELEFDILHTRIEIWDSLPERFRLGSWEELRKKKK